MNKQGMLSMYTKAMQTLREQMYITDAEIQLRLELVALSDKCIESLRSVGPTIEENVDLIVEEFYKAQLNIDQIAILIGDADTLYRLKHAQRQYILDLFSGQYDSSYVNNRLRIGMVHKRIGVEPKLYLSAVSTLKNILVKQLESALENDEILYLVLSALDKLLYFDTTLVFDTYIGSMISELELAQEKTSAYANTLEQKVAERTAQLEALASLDPLTGVHNQRAMREILTRMIASAKRRNSVVSLVYFDIDNFKRINDEYGHLKGDEVLKAIGDIMKKSIRESDLACRYGGDEFCIGLMDTPAEEARQTCERIVSQFSLLYPEFSISMGVEQTGAGNYLGVEELIGLADQKMYKAKSVSGSHIYL
jgi:diguanylate cyclase (GGDEF)-like protein